MANQKHLKILKLGAKAWNAWREKGSADALRPDLTEANLHRADLRGANLDGAYLLRTNLNGVGAARR